MLKDATRSKTYGTYLNQITPKETYGYFVTLFFEFPNLLFLYSEQVENLCDYEVDYLVHGTAMLEDAMTVLEAGLQAEAHIEAHCTVEGGKRKRKKKKYTTPKKVKHVHKKSPKKVLEYYQVDESGKIKRLKMESPHAPVGTYMADHPDRYVCGKTGFTLWRTNDKGERLAIPKQTHKTAEQKKEEKPAAAAKKKKK